MAIHNTTYRTNTTGQRAYDNVLSRLYHQRTKVILYPTASMSLPLTIPSTFPGTYCQSTRATPLATSMTKSLLTFINNSRKASLTHISTAAMCCNSTRSTKKPPGRWRCRIVSTSEQLQSSARQFS
eukprot:6492238-Amphidinium_carterae.2